MEKKSKRGPKPKKGLDFYPKYVRNNSDIRILFLKHQAEGIWVYHNILDEIYGEEGYYMNYNELNILVLADNCRVSVDLVHSVIQSCLERSLFDQDMFADYQILTSKEIQGHWAHVVRDRREQNFVPEYMLVCTEKLFFRNKKAKSDESENEEDSTSHAGESIKNTKGIDEAFKVAENGTNNAMYDGYEASTRRVESSTNGEKNNYPSINSINPPDNCPVIAINSPDNSQASKEGSKQASKQATTVKKELNGEAVFSNFINESGFGGVGFDSKLEEEVQINSISDTEIGNTPQKTATTTKKKKGPHPIRGKFIKEYEDWTETVFVNDIEPNASLKRLITRIEKNEQKRFPTLSEEELWLKMEDQWRYILGNWSNLPAWMQTHRELKFIDSHFASILNILKSTSSSTQQTTYTDGWSKAKATSN